MGEKKFQTIRISSDLWSRLTDGILPAVVLILTWSLIVLSINPIQQSFGQPGLMVYTLGLLAISMFVLQHSIQERHSHILRAWYGIAGGFLGWAVTEVSILLGAPLLFGPGGAIIIIMVALVFYILWINGLPMGVKFFVIVFLLNWAAHLFVELQGFFALDSPFFSLMYRVTGYLAAIGMILTLGYIMFNSRRRIERVCASVVVWFLFSLVIYIFRGTLY